MLNRNTNPTRLLDPSYLTSQCLTEISNYKVTNMTYWFAVLQKQKLLLKVYLGNSKHKEFA